MSALATGPIVLGEMPLRPRIAHDGLFAALLEPVVNTLGGLDAPLASAHATIATNTDAGLDATFTLTVGAAAGETAGQPNQFGDTTAAALHDAGGGVDAYRGSVAPFLPQPDAPVESGFRDFPVPDFGAPNQDPGAIPPPPEI